jgi:hypothetical protein
MTIAKVQSATSASATVALTGVGAGNLIVMNIRWSSANNVDGCSVSDGTSALTMGTVTHNSAAEQHMQFAYLLSANSGNRTYTITYPAGSSEYRVEIIEFSHTGTIEYDTENTGTGSSSTAASGVISTASASELVCSGGANYQKTFSSPTIGGSEVTETIYYNNYNYLGYTIFTSTQTNIAAGHTCAASDSWNCHIIAFKETLASGLSIPVAMAGYRRRRM